MKTKPTKAWAAAIGQVITAAGVGWAAVEASLADGFTFADVSSIVVAALGFAGTVYTVWRVENKPVV